MPAYIFFIIIICLTAIYFENKNAKKKKEQELIRQEQNRKKFYLTEKLNKKIKYESISKIAWKEITNAKDWKIDKYSSFPVTIDGTIVTDTKVLSVIKKIKERSHIMLQYKLLQDDVLDRQDIKFLQISNDEYEYIYIGFDNDVVTVGTLLEYNGNIYNL